MKNKRRDQPPTDPLTSDGAWTTDKEAEPSLREAMAILGNVMTRMAANEERALLWLLTLPLPWTLTLVVVESESPCLQPMVRIDCKVLKTKSGPEVLTD